MAISDYFKRLLDDMNQRSNKVKLGTVIQTAETAIATNASDISTLEGLVNGVEVVAAELVTTVGGAAAEAITVTGAAAGDVCLVTINAVGDTPVTIVSAIASADTVTVTFSADPADDHVVNLVVIRPSA